MAPQAIKYNQHQAMMDQPHPVRPSETLLDEFL
jgi:hypothetical protein